MAGQKAKWTNILTTTRNEVHENCRATCTTSATPNVLQPNVTGQFPTVTTAGANAYGGTGNVFNVTFSEKYSVPTSVNLTVVQTATTGAPMMAHVTSDYNPATGVMQFALATAAGAGASAAATYTVLIDATFELGR